MHAVVVLFIGSFRGIDKEPKIRFELKSSLIDRLVRSFCLWWRVSRMSIVGQRWDWSDLVTGWLVWPERACSRNRPISRALITPGETDTLRSVENGGMHRERAIRPGNRKGGFVAGYCVTSDIRAADTATRDCCLVFSSTDGGDSTATDRAGRTAPSFNYADEFDDRNVARRSNDMTNGR